MIKLLPTLKRFLKFIFTAKTRFSVHSPLVYFVLTELIQSKKTYYCYSKILKTKSALLKNTNKIEVTELGAGSHFNNSKQKKISAIAKNASKANFISRYLFELVNHFQPKTILELGTSFGLSTLYMAHACKNAAVYTLEGCPNTAKIAQQNFDAHGLSNIDMRIGDFKDTLTPLLSELKHLGFVFVDGNHQKKATLHYFELCLQKSDSKTVMVFDDIHWSMDMEEAWEAIKTHPKVTVSIDLFWIGIVFLNQNQAEEHFVLNPFV